MGSLTNKVALVTGASRGIGRAIAERLADEGAAVVVNYRQSAEAAQTVVATIHARGGSAVALEADIRQRAAVHELVTRTVTHFGRLDILVNNAGGGVIAALPDITEELWDEQFARNAKGALFAMQAAAPHLGAGGRIINISATVSTYGVAGAALYGGAKRALEYFTLALAHELGPQGITVNTVSPGGVATDVYRAHAPAVQRAAAQASPLGRMGTPTDIAEVVVFLASEQGRWMTGQNLAVDGGARA